MKTKESYIHLSNLKFFAFHGVLPQERQTGANFLVSLRVYTDLGKASESDALKDTISYGDLFLLVKEEMGQPSQLLEHVAGRICRHIYADFPSANAIDITIEKENAPLGIGAQGLAGITLHTMR